jgi:hypothetical protein
MIQKKLFPFSVLFFFLLTLQSFADDNLVDREKKIIKSYAVSVNDKLSIENESGAVNINTWEKNEVSVEIIVKSGAKSATKAQELLESVSISDTKTAGAIYLKSIFKAGSYRSGKQTLNVDYIVYMPATLQLSVVNKFGNVNLPSFAGHLQVKVSYGNIKAAKLTGPHEKRIEVGFGSASIEELDNAFLESKYSKVNIEFVGKAEIMNSFGKTKIMEANNLRITQKYGDLELRKVNTLVGNIEFSNVDLDYLGKSADLHLKYASNADLGVISSSVELLKINASFSTVYLKFDDTANQDFEAHLKYGDIKLNNQYMKEYVKNTNQHNSSSDYKGKIGKGGKGNLLINSNYTTVHIR